MLKIHLHQTHFTIGDFNQISDYLLDFITNKNQEELEGIHVFPEMFLSGYPLQDLCLNKSFIKRYHEVISEIESKLAKINNIKNKLQKSEFLLGGLEYFMDSESSIYNIYNSILSLNSDLKLKPIYQKRLLPNYDIFDEQKYFTPGQKPVISNILGMNCALLICEDMWKSSFHKIDPIKEYFEIGTEKIDFVINLSASPFNYKKNSQRIQQAKIISNKLKSPFIYVNKVGAEDEIIFDGGSFICNGNDVIAQLEYFQKDYKSIDLQNLKNIEYENYDLILDTTENTWNNLFKPNVSFKDSIPLIEIFSDHESSLILSALMFGLKEYCEKTQFKKISIALSGGMDSALVLTIAYLTMKKYPEQINEINAIYMPSQFSSDLSFNCCKKLCQRLEIKLNNLPIKFLHNVCKREFSENLKVNLDGISDENIQSRLRGSLIYAYSNVKNSLVLNTSNKSELAVGYSTLYGDSVGAISILGDLYKSEVYKISSFINKKFQNIIPNEIITRPATAELKPNQKDEDSLPPYKTLDTIIELYLSFLYTEIDIINLGFSKEDVLSTVNLLNKSEYKRFQFCPILKVKARSFGFGYRVPITKHSLNILKKRRVHG
jgi:NAD+ synthase (glutamine-hydrolysing)